MKNVDELRQDLNLKLKKFRKFRIENGKTNNDEPQEQKKKGFFKKIFS